MAEPEITEDVIYGGRLRIRQPAAGYRVNVDTVLLGASAPRSAVSVAEAGCGVGAALLIAALNGAPEGRYLGLERNAASAALARANAAANGMAARVQIETGDALAPSPTTFDAILCNPPFAYAGEGRAPDPSRYDSHIADRPIGAWIKALSNRLSGGGSLTLIHRAERLAEILAALEGRLGGVAVFPVRPFAGAPAHRIFVRATKGSRAPLRLLAGLDLHPAEGGEKHTAATEAILRGEAPLRFD